VELGASVTIRDGENRSVCDLDPRFPSKLVRYIPDKRGELATYCTITDDCDDSKS
jgi:hypothetical protein